MDTKPTPRSADEEARAIRQRLEQFLAAEEEEFKRDEELIRDVERKAQAAFHPEY
jgi:hypothetical protein